MLHDRLFTSTRTQKTQTTIPIAMEAMKTKEASVKPSPKIHLDLRPSTPPQVESKENQKTSTITPFLGMIDTHVCYWNRRTKSGYSISNFCDLGCDLLRIDNNSGDLYFTDIEYTDAHKFCICHTL